MSSNKPRRGELYNVRQILAMDLTDTPCLMIPVPEKFGFAGQGAIQDPDMGWEAAAEIIGDLVFRYIETTDEMIPVFEYEDDPICLSCLDISLDLLPYGDEPGIWVLPKGDTRKQDYRWAEAGVSLEADFTDAPEPAPKWLVEAYNHLNQA